VTSSWLAGLPYRSISWTLDGFDRAWTYYLRETRETGIVRRAVEIGVLVERLDTSSPEPVLGAPDLCQSP
jgi:hypothetical protein